MNDPRDMQARILYVDDDAAFVRLAQKALGRSGYEVVHADNIAAGLELLGKGDIDAIVLDHYLQNTTGAEFLKVLRENSITVPVVYVTGSSEAKIAIDALKAGAADYVIKTVGEEFMPLLESAVAQAIATAELRRDRERADMEILRGKERAEVLLTEVNHRVGNSLALVAALIRLQISSIDNEEVKHALTEAQARITAIGGMHRSLYSSDDVRQVEMDKYLASLTSELRSSLEHADHKLTISLDVEDIRLSSDQAVSVGMVVTELVTNAYKYAYPDTHNGEIRISFLRAGEDKAVLAVEDDGVGWQQTDQPKGTGLGTRIVKAMAASLGTGIDYTARDKGTRAELVVNTTR
ncbi:histidine kinase dimerization/phosphoacceptor domain -containing protein [Phyllobacterium sp. YR531]|uniref:histidine kinase dimerization/phosphoacceptor domain -containing protein n=1 Tax=Phyllobacterium sp. YR531 TaxID=1144343 RepID=UPI0032980879